MTAPSHVLRRLATTLVLSLVLATVVVPPATATTAANARGSSTVAEPAGTGGTLPADDATIKNVTTPFFVGTPKVGYTLSARPGRWNPATATIAYAWFDGARQLGTGPTYVVTRAELGRTISITATATAPGRAAAAVSWASPSAVVRGTFWIGGAPKILGRAKIGQRLKARSSATEPDGRRTYRWLRDGKAIHGATGPTYRVKKADRRHRLTVRVVYTATAYETATRTARSTHRVK